MRVEVIRERHDPPPGLQAQLAEVGGCNLYGEPLYRVVWGWNRLTLVGGKWTDYDDDGNVTRSVVEYRMEPKYLWGDGVNRWHIEKWLPPQSIAASPRHWDRLTKDYCDGQTIFILGPYPSRGEYEHLQTLQEKDGSFMQLTPRVCESLIQLLNWSLDRHSASDRKVALEHREQEREQAHRDKDKALLDDVAPAFYGEEFIQVERNDESWLS